MGTVKMMKYIFWDEGVAINKTAKYICLSVIGMSFYWQFLRRSYFGLLLSGHNGLTPDSQTYYVIFLAVTVLLALASIILYRKMEHLIRKSRVPVLLIAFLASVGGIVVMIFPEIPILFAFLTTMGIIFIAAAFLVLTFAWGIWITDTQTITTQHLILSFILGFLVSLLMVLNDPLPSIVVVAAPLLSAVCWFLCQKESVGKRRVAHSHKALRKLPIDLIAILSLFLIVGGFMRGLVWTGTINYIPGNDAIPSHLVSILIAFIMFFPAMFFRQKELLYRYVWISFSALFFAGFFLIISFNPDWNSFGGTVLIIGRTFLGFLLWVVLVNAIRETNLSSVVVLGIFFVLIEMLSAFLSYVIVPAIPEVFGVSFSSYANLLSIGMALMLIVASFLAISPKRHTSTVDSTVVPDSVRWETACHTISDHFGLTKREAEVMSLIAKGHSKSKIAGMLYVSSGTVQSHTKNIYRKLNIHSRQGLIDMVDAYQSEITSF